MTNNMSRPGGEAIALLEDRGFLRELAQVRARATLETLGSGSGHINWTFGRRRLERNGTAGVFSMETAAQLAPDAVDDSQELRTAALRLAQLWEALATTFPQGSEAALMTAAVAYEIAGYQANAATIGQRLRRPDSDWAMTPMVTDFLRRRLLAVVAQQTDLESSGPPNLELSAFVGAAADRLLGRALASVSRYLISGDRQQMRAAGGLLDRSRDAYSRLGRLPEANLCFATMALLPLIERRTTWALIGASSPAPRWERYLKLLGRGTGGRPIDARSFSELWPSQVAALNAGLISTGDSMVLRLPTSAGKTRIAEIAIAFQLSNHPNSRCLYIAPYRALVSELELLFSRMFSDLGIRVSSFFGAYDDEGFEHTLAQDSELIIATPERLDLLERTAPEFFDDVELIILDEGQIVADNTRGLKCELLMARLKVRLPRARFLVLSAVISEQSLVEFAEWLESPQSAIVRSEWRPSVQRVARFEWQGDSGVIRYEASDDLDFQGQFLHGVIRKREFEHVNPNTGRTRRPRFPDTTNKSQTAAELALHFSGVGPVLVFCPQTNFVESTAQALSRRLDLASLTGEEVPPHLAETERPSVRSATEWLGPNHKISELLRRGIGVHHGRLPDAVRSAIELDFRERRLPILIATTTLGQGVNLPVRTVIVHSSYRQEEDERVRVPAAEYWNIAGRAGRAGFETEGTVVHLTFNSRDQRDFRYYQDRRTAVPPLSSALLSLLNRLREDRITAEDAARLLNPEILAIMAEEDLGAFEESVDAILAQSLVTVQAAGRGAGVEPLAQAMKSEGRRVRTAITDVALLQLYRQTGLSSDACVVVTEALRGQPQLDRLLRSAAREAPRDLIQLLARIVSVVPEFSPVVEPPVDYVEAVALWLRGETVSEIERQLLGDVSADIQFGRFAGQFFVHTLPWAASATVLLGRHETGLNQNDLGAVARSLPTMLRFGVPTPEAAWCMSLGIASRRVAIGMSADYRALGGEASYSGFLRWFSLIEPSELINRYGLQGPSLENTIRSVIQFGAFSDSARSFEVAATLPVETQVVGTQYEQRWATARLLSPGEPLDLRRELDNAYDRNAILVVHSDSELGYVPRALAQVLAPEIDSGLQVAATVTKVETDAVEMRIEPL